MMSRGLSTSQFDVVIVGAGAAGLMCAAKAGQRGRRVLLIDHARAPGEKIRISGGGRCNFTNIGAGPKNFISANPHFAKSALARFTPRDFLDLVESHGIAWHEKTLGQLFCDNSAKDIIAMLLDECRAGNVELRLQTDVGEIARDVSGFRIRLETGTVTASSLVIATGGRSIPKMGATGFAYDLAGQFGIAVVEPRPGLVPFTLDPLLLERVQALAGIAVPAEVRSEKTAFSEALLFTHRGISGPAILQISSYWKPGGDVTIRILPDLPLGEHLLALKRDSARMSPLTALSQFMPRKLAQFFVAPEDVNQALADMADKKLLRYAGAVQDWRVKPAGTEGYRTAEVTLGGIDTKALSSQTLEARDVPGLFFIGESVDVTGWLGGYNFQWAWASAVAASEAV